MSWVAVGSAAVAVVGGVVQNKAAKKAAKAQGQASDAAIAEQQRARAEYQSNIAPYLQLGQQGTEGLSGLLSNPANFAQNPAYQFLQDQSLQALDRSAAARGRFLSPGTDADRIKLASGLASQEYGNQFNRYYNLASLGQNAAAGAGSAAQTTANNIGSLYQGRGAAQADAAINQANAISSGLQGLGTTFGQYVGNRPNPDKNNQTSIYSFGNNQDWYSGIPGSNQNTFGNNPFLGRP